jgi:hypothetical protein
VIWIRIQLVDACDVNWSPGRALDAPAGTNSVIIRAVSRLRAQSQGSRSPKDPRCARDEPPPSLQAIPLACSLLLPRWARAATERQITLRFARGPLGCSSRDYASNCSQRCFALARQFV